jgi:hypothetical protein
MFMNSLICLSAAVLCAATGALALVRDVRSTAYRAFALGMGVFAAQAVLSRLGLNAMGPSEAAAWSRWYMAAGALVPGSWLLFSLSYARSNFYEFGRTWRWVIVAAFVLPVGLAVLGWPHLLGAYAILERNGNWVMPLGWAGYGLYVILLLFSAMVVANLEKTLRTSHGAIRWQIKFAILGVGAIFAALIYTAAQVLLSGPISSSSTVPCWSAQTYCS